MEQVRFKVIEVGPLVLPGHFLWFEPPGKAFEPEVLIEANLAVRRARHSEIDRTPPMISHDDVANHNVLHADGLCVSELERVIHREFNPTAIDRRGIGDTKAVEHPRRHM